MAAHSSILAWRIPWTEESMGSQRVWTRLSTRAHVVISYFCLDGTQVKWLNSVYFSENCIHFCLFVCFQTPFCLITV